MNRSITLEGSRTPPTGPSQPQVFPLSTGKPESIQPLKPQHCTESGRLPTKVRALLSPDPFTSPAVRLTVSYEFARGACPLECEPAIPGNVEPGISSQSDPSDLLKVIFQP